MDRVMLSRTGVFICRGFPDVIAGRKEGNTEGQDSWPWCLHCHVAGSGPAGDPFLPSLPKGLVKWIKQGEDIRYSLPMQKCGHIPTHTYTQSICFHVHRTFQETSRKVVRVRGLWGELCPVRENFSLLKKI